jgi:hypothetical protein
MEVIVHTKSRRFLILMALAAGVASSACDTATPPPSDDLPPVPFSGAQEAVAFAIRVLPRTLEFTHRVGGNDCPQLVGKITITNTDLARRTPTVVAGPHLGFRQGSGLVNGVMPALEPGQTIELEVYFACTTQTNFTSTITVSSGNATSGEVEVKGTVG